MEKVQSYFPESKRKKLRNYLLQSKGKEAGNYFSQSKGKEAGSYFSQSKGKETGSYFSQSKRREARSYFKEEKRKDRKIQGTGLSKSLILFLILLSVFFTFSIAILCMVGNGGKQEVQGSAPPKASITPAIAQTAQEKKIHGILENVDGENKVIQVYSIETSERLSLGYSSSTDIKDKYGRIIVAEQYEIGDILQIIYEEDARKALSVIESSEVWEHIRKTGLSKNGRTDILSMEKKNYSVTDALHIYDGATPIKLEDISPKDSVTIRGIGDKAYVVLLTKGHGYLTLKEAQDYIGGSLYLNLDLIAQVTEDMRLEVTEGNYEVTIMNGEMTAQLPVQIKRWETNVLDLTQYAKVPTPSGQITFRIQPEGAVLWLDDKMTYYGDPVKLDYGIHQVRVELGGYLSYEGKLIVDSAADTIHISLPENSGDSSGDGQTENPGDSSGDGQTENPGGSSGGGQTENPGDSSGDGQTGNPGDNSGNASENPSGTPDDPVKNPDNTSDDPSDGSYVTDNNHSIIIYSDDEVEIYLNGDYMGVTEEGMATFEKYIGSFTLRLVKGDESKEYMIQVDDDGEDFVFRRYFE